jgi:hypothetical protein
MAALPNSVITPEVQKCLDRWYPLAAAGQTLESGLRGHPRQDALVREQRRFKVVPAGRRCLEAGTLVATPSGPLPIELLRVGDAVIGYQDGRKQTTVVTAVWDNGRQTVFPIYDGESKVLAATETHKLWACHEDGSYFERVPVNRLANHLVLNVDGFATRLTVGAVPHVAQTYDITVGNDSNLYCLANGIVTSNSGKTERAKRYIAREALRTPGMYFIGAPTHDQVRRIYWADMKLLCFAALLGPRSISEVDLTIKLPNGSLICLIGFDKPERFEGVPWDGGIIDEVADLKTRAWPENIAPALDTVDPSKPNRRAWAWLIGVPDGLNHYYDLAEYARTSGDADWGIYHWKSSEILPADVIDAAKRRMSARQFRQEYEAAFEGASGRIYEDYGDGNLTTEELQRHEPIAWMHDFNYTPLSSAIGAVRGGSLYLMDEIVLESAVARQAAEEFAERYKDHENKTVTVYGDPAGKAGEKHGQVSNYTAIEAYLRERGWSVSRKVKAAAPAIRDRQNAVRAKICNAVGHRNLFCNPNRAKWAHKGLSTVQVKEGSTFLEDDKSQYQHITTAIGYCVDYEWPVLIDANIKPQIVVPVPSVSHFGRNR